MSEAAQLCKQEGNEAFAAADFISAKDRYTEAMQLDPSQYSYPLNRSMTNLKLERWNEAEEDATTALALSPRNVKAYFRRAYARREQGNLEGAEEDIHAYADADGDERMIAGERAKVLEALVGKPASFGTTPSLPNGVQDVPSFYLGDSKGAGLGAFAARVLRRGDLILAEEPLCIANNPDDSGLAHRACVSSAVGGLNAREKQAFYSLANSFQGSRLFDNLFGTWNSNAFGVLEHGQNHSVLCLRASRLNHSCRPNARHSWNEASGRLRIYALCDIQVGEEILTSYISSRNVYGNPRSARQARLKKYGFTCACAACTLPKEEQAASDRRREEINRIWEMIPHYGPTRTNERLRSIVRAIRLMQEEKYMADADDFTNDAAGICACYSDWASVDYWAKKTYEIRVEEFGEDGERAREVRSLNTDLRSHSMASALRMQTFNIRL